MPSRKGTLHTAAKSFEQLNKRDFRLGIREGKGGALLVSQPKKVGGGRQRGRPCQPRDTKGRREPAKELGGDSHCENWTKTGFSSLTEEEGGSREAQENTGGGEIK